ncbi:MAG: 30S ribosomal protein S6 [Anaerolineae bacterium]|nr:30S ribosomal protein S6 [Anaerolineae bacterium]
METRNYELMLVVSAELDEDALDNVLQRVQRYLEAVEAQVVSFKSWGLRRLAYTIKNTREGRYYLVHFSASSQVIPELDGDLRLIEGVLRHLITRMETEMPAASEEEEKAAPELQAAPEPETASVAETTSDTEA